MVYYGPWTEPPVQTHTLGNLDDLDTGLRLNADGSQWGVENRQDTDPAGSTADPSISEFVWTNLPSEVPLEHQGDPTPTTAAFLRYVGGHELFIGPPERYIQSDYWVWTAQRWRLGQVPKTPQYEPELPPGASHVEYEEFVPANLVSVHLGPMADNPDSTFGLGPTDAPYWTLFIKAAGVTDWSFYNEPTTKSQLLAAPVATDGYDFTATEVAALQELLGANEIYDPPAEESDGRWLELSLAYTGPFPGDLPGAPPVYPTNEWVYEVAPRVELRVEFTVPRYRFVYEHAPQPPRRIFPRDDGLTGGARRTYPPSKGLQSSNRTTGGYL